MEAESDPFRHKNISDTHQTLHRRRRLRAPLLRAVLSSKKAHKLGQRRDRKTAHPTARSIPRALRAKILIVKDGMLRAVLACYGFSDRRFINFAITKTDGKSLHRSAGLPRHQSDDK